MSGQQNSWLKRVKKDQDPSWKEIWNPNPDFGNLLYINRHGCQNDRKLHYFADFSTSLLKYKVDNWNFFSIPDPFLNSMIFVGKLRLYQKIILKNYTEQTNFLNLYMNYMYIFCKCTQKLLFLIHLLEVNFLLKYKCFANII